ncbi:hypothetical protein E2A64_10290 [Pseudohoeflea suaedae]|uniref:Uncharacterized protein n=1 Tax=Pseudohoeflea suaedae TaxID=877384 RepID=A0A4R5PJF5_9HYPH|nr:hypothetical protein E2A64_10290 [Pseudohoeflea suaedae]
MLIKMTVGLSGVEYSLNPGDERDFPQDEAIRLIEAGYAAPVAERKVEKAVKAPAPERRVKRGGKNVVSANGNGPGDRAH